MDGSAGRGTYTRVRDLLMEKKSAWLLPEPTHMGEGEGKRVKCDLQQFVAQCIVTLTPLHRKWPLVLFGGRGFLTEDASDY